MTDSRPNPPCVFVVIPSYKVISHVLGVIEGIGAEVHGIVVVDDACPDGSGKLVLRECKDPRVHVLFHESNQGVGGAVMTGYRHAIGLGADVIVKMDGDGQMDASLLPRFIAPITSGQADYAKGNRFYDLRSLRQMPRLRLYGNAVLSFMAKISTGYWDIFDPTNGFTAIDARVAAALDLDKVSSRYFFETDLMFRLGIHRAVVVDVPMPAHYADEVSNLRISRILGEFLTKHLRNFVKRIFYNYFLRDMSIASVELLLGSALLTLGSTFGAFHWARSLATGIPATTGTVMVAVLPVLMGFQLLLAFLAYDFASVPKVPMSGRLGSRANQGGRLPA